MLQCSVPSMALSCFFKSTWDTNVFHMAVFNIWWYLTESGVTFTCYCVCVIHLISLLCKNRTCPHPPTLSTLSDVDLDSSLWSCSHCLLQKCCHLWSSVLFQNVDMISFSAPLPSFCFQTINLYFASTFFCIFSKTHRKHGVYCLDYLL